MRLSCSTLQYTLVDWPLPEALQNISSIGYEGIELSIDDVTNSIKAGKYANPQEISRTLKELKLEVAAFDLGTPWYGSKWKKEFLRALDISHNFEVKILRTASCRWPEKVNRTKSFNEIAENMGWGADMVSKEGCILSVEAALGRPIENSTTFLNVREIAGNNLYANFDPSNYYLGGDDPIKSIRKLKEIIASVHMKDSSRSIRGGAFTPMGEGEIDIPMVIQALYEINYDDWITLEYEGSLSGFYKEPDRGSIQSYKYMKEIIDGLR